MLLVVSRRTWLLSSSEFGYHIQSDCLSVDPDFNVDQFYIILNKYKLADWCSFIKLFVVSYNNHSLYNVVIS